GGGTVVGIFFGLGFQIEAIGLRSIVMNCHEYFPFNSLSDRSLPCYPGWNQVAALPGEYRYQR
ncbi:MAG: hypothetical protein ACLR2M_10270, partial [Varibaculum sp.]